jgi:hypothetical protein
MNEIHLDRMRRHLAFYTAKFVTDSPLPGSCTDGRVLTVDGAPKVSNIFCARGAFGIGVSCVCGECLETGWFRPRTFYHGTAT